MQFEEQLARLDEAPARFTDFVEEVTGRPALQATGLEVFQINVGKLCNQACRHCHVDAGPKRTELMDRATAEACLEIIEATDSIHTVDITGGAPELNPNFRMLVERSRAAGKHVIDRCNLTVAETRGMEWLLDFLTEHRVEVVASLPHFAASRTDQQRGRGVFDASTRVLQALNERGYGRDPGLRLNLVYNPTGAFLSGAQEQLEREFKEQLASRYGIEFNNLYCINNMPISRYLESLIRAGKFESYMETLAGAFNPATLDGLMCRNQISVSYDGYVYDCDFNQMLDLKADGPHISELDPEAFGRRNIALHNHCFGCTAGQGSSCGGEIAQEPAGVGAG